MPENQKTNFNACLKNGVFSLESYVGDEFPELCSFLQSKQDKITSLTIAHNDLMDKSKVLLLAGIFANMPRLTAIKLNDNSISDEAAKYIALLLESNTRLNNVDLSNNNIHDKGAIAIAHALTAQTNVELNLMMNNIGDNAAKTMARIFGGSKHSVGLDMQLCNLTDACGQDLQEALKNNPNFRVNVYLNDIDDSIVRKIDEISRHNAVAATLSGVEEASKPSASASSKSAGMIQDNPPAPAKSKSAADLMEPLAKAEKAGKPWASVSRESTGIFTSNRPASAKSGSADNLKGRLSAHRKNVEKDSRKEEGPVDNATKRRAR